jgi:hypothetical protein
MTGWTVIRRGSPKSKDAGYVRTARSEKILEDPHRAVAVGLAGVALQCQLERVRARALAVRGVLPIVIICGSLRSSARVWP